MKNSILSLIGLFTFLISYTQTVDDYVSLALGNNPKIKALSLKYKRATEKINQVNTLPDTQFGAGYFISSPETRTGPQKFKLSVNQKLPWFGTIKTRQNYMNAISEVKGEDIAIAKRKLALEVKRQYYQLYGIRAKQKVITENIKLLKTYETLALTAVKVGKASLVDVLKLQIRSQDLKKQIEVLEQDFLAKQTSFNKLLNRQANKEIAVVDSLVFPEKSDNISNANLKIHPELIKFDKLSQSVQKSELLNKKEKAPKIGFGLSYIAVDKIPNMNFKDNGKDIVMPMISVSIPIFDKKHNSITKQNRLNELEIKSERENRLNTLEAELNQAIKMQKAARISYQTQVKNLKKTKDAEAILLKTYETSTVDFDDILDIEQLQLRFQTGQIEDTQNFYIQTAIINYFSN